MKNKITKMHIELDVVNKAPTIVFTDVDGEEWVLEEQSSANGFITKLVKKSESWYFKNQNNEQKH